MGHMGVRQPLGRIMMMRGNRAVRVAVILGRKLSRAIGEQLAPGTTSSFALDGRREAEL